MVIDPSALTLAQTTFLTHINDAFDVVTRYALNLVYLFAGLEIAVFGILWALQQGAEWGRLFFKIIKIGLIFFIIQNYPTLINSIIRSFATVGGLVANTKDLQQIIFSPTGIWQYGYDVSLGLLKIAALSTSFGLTLINTMLGTGILLTLGLIGIQIVLQIVAFYLVSLVALLLLPFGIFNPSASMLEKGVQNVFKAGVRVMVLIAVVGVAVTIFSQFDAIDLSTATAVNNYNLSQFLGLFFTSLLFLCLAIFLPKLAADVVGSFSMRLGEISRAPIIVPPSQVSTVGGGTQAITGVNAVQAATSLTPTQGGVGYAANMTPQATTITTQVGVGGAGATGGGGAFGSDKGSKLGESAALTKELRKQSISANTLKKLTKTLDKLSKD